jgi:uncharacterized membrane protein YfcA
MGMPFEWQQLAVGAAAALLVGLTKTAMPGLGMLIVVLMAMAFDNAKLSVGALLPLLICGDLFAVGYYRRHAQWKRIWPLLPWVALGMGLAALFLRWIPNHAFRPFLGGLVLALIVLDLLRRRMSWSRMPGHPAFGASIGVLAGFATTIGNAAGSIMIIYLLSHGLDKQRFIGTLAWYFLIVNAAKVPLFAALGMITPQTLLFDVFVIAFVASAALAGARLLPRIPQRVFNTAVLLLAAAAALKLLLG